ncbi:MAG: SRPBCC domain-containing protein [Chloroflexota bacterium]
MTQISNLIIEHDIFIRAEPTRVYDAFTTASELDTWFTTGAEVDPHPGGYMTWRWKDWGPNKETAEDGGAVLEANRPHRYVFQWRKEPSTVSLDFEPVAEGTIVRLRETGYLDTFERTQVMLGCAAGWGEALTLLKFYVEHGIVY